MESYLNLKILQNFYLMQSLGYEFCDPLKLHSSFQQSQPIATTLQTLQKQIQECCLCDYSKSATQPMVGFGNPHSEIIFIDETVSDIQDSQNCYFCGRSGLILQDMIQNVLKKNINDVYFTHMIKCKPLHLKQSNQEHWNCCQGYLFSQINLIKPKIIVFLGEKSYYRVFPSSTKFEEIRGHIIEFAGYKAIAIYHPAYLLRNPELKKVTYYDLKTIKSCL